MQEILKNWLWMIPTMIWVFSFTWTIYWTHKLRKLFFTKKTEDLDREEELPDNVIPFRKNQDMFEDYDDDAS